MIYIIILRPPILFKNQLFVVMGRPIHANNYPKSTANPNNIHNHHNVHQFVLK